MSFQFSAGTLDSMAGVFAPTKKYRLGSAGGKGAKAKASGTMLAIAVSSMLPRATQSAASYRPGSQAKAAFGAGTHASVSGRALATMERTARRTPEVMVRVTGRQHGGGHVLANFSYISRLGHGAEKQMALHTSDGDVLHDGRDMQILAQDWQEWEMGGGARRKGATSISMILSMPTGTDPERLQAAALDFAREEFANRSWVASLHVDRDHPHVHLTVARRDHDGRRFHPDRDDLFRYRQRFAEKLRDRGIDANATPAKARGIDSNHEPIAARKVRAKGAVPRIDQSRAERSQRLGRGNPDPVKAVLSNQQVMVRRAYEQSIAELSASPSFVDQAIAKSLEKFVASLGAPEPNSVRSIAPGQTDRDEQMMRGAPAPRGGEGPEAHDAVAASLARAQAMRERLTQDEIDRQQQRPDGAPSAIDEKGDAPPDLATRLRTLRQRAEDGSLDDAAHGLDDTLRSVQERDRAQRERDRTKDRDGPSR